MDLRKRSEFDADVRTYRSINNWGRFTDNFMLMASHAQLSDGLFAEQGLFGFVPRNPTQPPTAVAKLKQLAGQLFQQWMRSNRSRINYPHQWRYLKSSSGD